MEDLHWADAASVEVLGFLAGQVRDQPVAVVATLRTGEGRDQVAGQLAACGAVVCPLGRLTGDATAAMAAACLRQSGAPGLREELALGVARAAEGLPLLVDRLEQARAEMLHAGALGLAAGIGVNLAAVQVMTARFGEARATAAEAGEAAARLSLRPIQAASHLLCGLAAACQGRRREMDRHLATAESLAPADADLRAGAWGIGRGMLALLE